MPTKIEWATESWNPITGCTPVSEGCENCYARRMSYRLQGRFGYPEDESFRVNWRGDYVAPSKGYPIIEEPRHWKKPRMIFVCSMGDLFHEDVLGPTIHHLIKLIKWVYKRHTFLILTKRPERMRRIWMNIDGTLPENIWLGVSVENQQRADERIPILLQIPAAKRFVSIEPMLGPVDLNEWLWQETTVCWGPGEDDWGHDIEPRDDGLDWVICGGESGPGARPMHPAWPRSIRDQCQAAGVPFFFKQWGEWQPHSERFGGGIFLKPDGTKTCQGDYWDAYAAAMNRVGKKAAGRLLDGREWNERPEVKYAIP